MAPPHAERIKAINEGVSRLKERQCRLHERGTIIMDGSDDARDAAHDMRNNLNHIGDTPYMVSLYLDKKNPTEDDIAQAEHYLNKANHRMQIVEDALDSRGSYKPEPWIAKELAERISAAPYATGMPVDNKAGAARVKADPRRLTREIFSLLKATTGTGNPKVAYATGPKYFDIEVSQDGKPITASQKRNIRQSIHAQRAESVAKLHGGKLAIGHSEGRVRYTMRIPLAR